MTHAAGSTSDKLVLGVGFAALGGAACLLTDLWLASGLARLAATGHWNPPPFSPVALLTALLRSGPAGLDGNAPVVFGVTMLILVVVEVTAGVWGAIWLADRLQGLQDPSRLARRGELGDLAGRKAAKKARSLRPSLASMRDLGADIGIRLMQVAGMDVWMSWEDVALIIMGPRSNKTSAIAVPTVLAANGPVVATSNKADIWALTRDLRAQVGPVWTFDPQLIAYAEQTWFTDPIAWIRSEPEDRRLEYATRFVSHFLATISGERADPFFTQAAERVATGAVLAAAATPDGTLREVLDYLADGRREAVKALDSSGAHHDAAELENTLSGADVTTEGIFETARTALRCLRSEALLRWVTPPRTWRTPPRDGVRVTEFDPWTLFVGIHEHPTLYLLSKEGGASSAPVVTAIVDRITDVAERTAQARGGRLDPSLVLMLDEAANICSIQNLPQLYSHWGSRGIQALTILQSYKQGVKVWTREGMDSLWSAATVKIAGAGLDDVETLQWISQAIGDRWVPKPPSFSRDSRGGSNDSFDMVQLPIMPVSSLRRIKKEEALLITAGRPVALGRLLPWYAESDEADAIKASGKAATEEVRASAVAYLGPSNPVARVLARTTR